MAMRKGSRASWRSWRRLAACRSTVIALAFASLAALVLAPPADAQATAPDDDHARHCAFTYIGQSTLDSATRFEDAELGDLPFGGLSGIDYDPSTGRYWAISDDRSTRGPARFYQLSIDLTRLVRYNGPEASAITIHSQHALRDADGELYDKWAVDPEAIRRVPGSSLIAWSSEGSRGYRDHFWPRVNIVDETGRFRQELQVPPPFLPAGTRGGESPGDRGVRNNRGFESLGVTPDGRYLYVAVENALAQDGPGSHPDGFSPSRILEYDLRRGRATAQFVYPVEPLPFRPLGGLAPAENGLVDLVALGDRRFLALERSFALGAGMRARLYWVDARQASDVSAIFSLKTSQWRPVVKKLLLDLGDLRSDTGASIWLDNVEGFTIGPTDPRSGQRTLVFVADNNFSWLQSTQFIAVAVRDLPALIAGRSAGICSLSHGGSRRPTDAAH